MIRDQLAICILLSGLLGACDRGPTDAEGDRVR